MSSGRLELLLDDLDIEAVPPPREAPPSRSMKLEVLGKLDRRSEIFAPLRDAAPFLIALSTLVTMGLAVTLWARRRWV